MRNPFARLARPAAARPTLRDRAAALKASAARVIRCKPVNAASAAPVAAAVSAADPILAAIAETRSLMTARVHAAALPQPAGSIDPLPEQEAAADTFNTYVDEVLLKTVPTTAAGCVALARYAVEFLGDDPMSNVHTFAPRPRPAATSVALPAPSPAEIRRQIEEAAQAALDTADRVVAILDRLDGDTDQEDGADSEPSLGAPENHHASQVVWLRGSSSDAEQDLAR